VLVVPAAPDERNFEPFSRRRARYRIYFRRRRHQRTAVAIIGVEAVSGERFQVPNASTRSTRIRNALRSRVQ
jgi:hypothetical protein